MAEDETLEERYQLDRAEDLSLLLCCTPAVSFAGLKAQIEWVKEDLGLHIDECAGTAHAGVFDTVLKSIENIKATAPTQVM